MSYDSMRPQGVEEDIPFTEYRLQIARQLPDGAFRDAVIAGIASRLAALSRKQAGFMGHSGARVYIWNGAQ